LRVIRAIARHSGYGGIWGIQCILFVCNNLRFDLDSQNGGAGGESGIRSFFAHLLSASYRKHNAKNAVNAIDPRAPCPPLPASMLGRSTGCALGLCTGRVSRGLWVQSPPRLPLNLHFPCFQVHSCILYPLFHLQPPAEKCGKRQKVCTRISFRPGNELDWIVHAHSLSRDFERCCGSRSTSDTLGGPMSLTNDRKAVSSGARSIRSTPLARLPRHSARDSHPELQRSADAGSVARSGVTGIACARSAVDGSCLGRFSVLIHGRLLLRFGINVAASAAVRIPRVAPRARRI